VNAAAAVNRKGSGRASLKAAVKLAYPAEVTRHACQADCQRWCRRRTAESRQRRCVQAGGCISADTQDILYSYYPAEQLCGWYLDHQLTVRSM